MTSLALQFARVWRYRELLLELFRTWFRLRHAGSVLGVFWTLLNPILMIGTYWFVFSVVFRVGIPEFPLLLIPGYLAWNFTFGSWQAAGESLLQSKYLITKIAFPNEIIVVTSVALALSDFLLALLLFLGVQAVAAPAGWVLFWLPPLLLLHIAFTLGVSFILATGAVYFKDVPRLIAVAGMVLFFMTPIFYTHDLVPGALQQLVWLNPLTWFFSAYQDVLYHHRAPAAGVLAGTTGLALAAFLGGALVFRKHTPAFAELS